MKDFAGNPDEVKEMVANQRLQTIASLPNWQFFWRGTSYLWSGFRKAIKRVRQTVNYLSDNTNVLAVIKHYIYPVF